MTIAFNVYALCDHCEQIIDDIEDGVDRNDLNKAFDLPEGWKHHEQHGDLCPDCAAAIAAADESESTN